MPALSLLWLRLLHRIERWARAHRLPSAAALRKASVMIERDLKIGERFRFDRGLLRHILDEAPGDAFDNTVIVEFKGVSDAGDGTVMLWISRVDPGGTPGATGPASC